MNRSNFDFSNQNWINDLLKNAGKSDDVLRNDFVRTGIRGLDEAISKCMDINDHIQSIGKK